MLTSFDKLTGRQANHPVGSRTVSSNPRRIGVGFSCDW